MKPPMPPRPRPRPPQPLAEVEKAAADDDEIRFWKGTLPTAEGWAETLLPIILPLMACD